jgi:hypothetical protein
MAKYVKRNEEKIIQSNNKRKLILNDDFEDTESEISREAEINTSFVSIYMMLSGPNNADILENESSLIAQKCLTSEVGNKNSTNKVSLNELGNKN